MRAFYAEAFFSLLPFYNENGIKIIFFDIDFFFCTELIFTQTFWIERLYFLSNKKLTPKCKWKNTKYIFYEVQINKDT
jgi:hypothetical protein